MSDMDGLCDVKECKQPTFMGWRPLTERRGRQICEYHWRQHRDKQDSFDLFDKFKFRRPVGLRKPVARKHVPRCACGREITPGHKFCDACAAERERLRKKQYYHNKKKSQVEPVEENTLRCKQCGGSRLPGYSYCQKCSQRRSNQSNRERQRRHYSKSVKC
jgi:hypothetical protein